jgi:hypothetical protein
MMRRMGLAQRLRLVAVASPIDPSIGGGRSDPAPAVHADVGLPIPEIASPFGSTSQLSTIVWSDLLDGAQLPMTRAEAMAVPAIAKARHVVAPKIAGTPLRAFRDATQLDDPVWSYRTDDGVSPWHRMVWTVDDLIFHGWSLWLARRGAAPTAELLAASRIRKDRWTFDSNSNLLVDGEPIAEALAILIPGPHEGILTYARTAIRHARQLLSAAANAGNTPSASMELHNTGDVELTQTQIDDLIGMWAAARRGENGGVGYTNRSLEVRMHGSIDAALLIDGRNAAAVDCARVVGVAAAMVDATAPKASLNYETTEGRGLEHSEYGIEPYMEAIAARLSLDDVVPRGQRVAFDLSEQLGPVQPTGAPAKD